MTGASDYAHPLVRSLAWLIGAPGLLAHGPGSQHGALADDTWCAAALKQAHPWLAQLDADPAVLDRLLVQHNVRRLGRLAELLLAFWLGNTDRFDLLAVNLAVRDGGRTLGDFDFVFRDHATGTAVHWELAVKFYLQRPGACGFTGYTGPAGQDILAAKADRVFSRQLKLNQTPAGIAALAALGLDQVEPRAFLKGWLFYPVVGEGRPAPGINPAHCRGWWRHHRSGSDHDWPRPGHSYRVIDRLEWLAWPCAAAGAFDATALSVCLDRHFASGGTALMVVEFDSTSRDAREIGRGFVVPAGWPNQANDALN